MSRISWSVLIVVTTVIAAVTIGCTVTGNIEVETHAKEKSTTENGGPLSPEFAY